MRILLVLIVTVVLAVSGYVFFTQQTSQDQAPSPSTGEVASVSDSSLSQRAAEVSPYRLEIPKLGVVANVEYVGMDEKGNMDVPKQDENVAWFEPGYKPGMKGNAVIAGHLDTRTGAPAVFYELDTLQTGDRIIVRGADDTSVTFTVSGKETYQTDDFPLQKVFGPSETPRLNLITCKGVYNTSSKSYSHRTVVYATLDR